MQNRQGEVKNSIGNAEVKELIYMTHGHELRWGNDGGRGGTGRRGIKGRKKWNNCNRIINKIYLKKEYSPLEPSHHVVRKLRQHGEAACRYFGK